MKCSKARKITYLLEYPEVVSSEMFEAKRHVNECPECRTFFEQEKAFSIILREKVTKDEAPPELKQRLLKPVPARKIPLSLTGKIISIAAILVLLVGGYIYKLHYDTKSFVDDIIDDHINFLSSSGIQIDSSDPQSIQEWFKERLDFGIRLPDLEANIKGARLCRLRDKRLGLVFYEHSGSQLSLFTTTELNPERLLSGKEVRIKNRKMHFIEQKGFTMLLWQEQGVTYALVSQLGIEKLEKILKEEDKV